MLSREFSRSRGNIELSSAARQEMRKYWKIARNLVQTKNLYSNQVIGEASWINHLMHSLQGDCIFFAHYFIHMYLRYVWSKLYVVFVSPFFSLFRRKMAVENTIFQFPFSPYSLI